MTPAEALAANRAFNAGAMGFAQAMARSGMDDGQLGAAAGSVGQLRDFENRQFRDRFGAATAALRMRETDGWRAGTGLRAATESAERRRAWLAANRERLAAQYERDRAALGRVETSGGLDARGRPVPFVGPGMDNAGAAYRSFLRDRIRRYEALRFASGGVVPGGGAGDTVPALLTPGEGVLNLRAMSALGPGFVHRFNQGGVVPGGAADGPGASGIVGLSQEARQAMDQFAGTSKELGTALAGFAAPAGLLTEALRGFDAGVTKFAGAVDRIPREIDLQTRGTVEVVVTGADFVGQAGGALGQYVANFVTAKIDEAFEARLPDLPRPHRADPTRLT